jgi:DNA helicase-2/ATP-dependent DNA helicase PcrA
MKEGELADRTFTPSAAVHRISYWKNQMTAVTEALRDARGPWEKKAALVYSRYEKRLRETGAVDFDDLLLLVVRLYAEHPSVLQYYRNLWRYVLVDEYQDTNRAQYRIIRLLTQEERNVCVVGDSDQSIYKWRGADIRNILDFEDDYPGTKVIRLEQNYRSTQNILALAAGVIAHNVSAKDKTLWTEKRGGRAGPAPTAPGTSRRRQASSPSRSWGCAGEGVPWTTWRCSTGPTPSRACWRMRCARGRIPT